MSSAEKRALGNSLSMQAANRNHIHICRETTASSGHSNYDESKGGSQVIYCKSDKVHRVMSSWWMGGSNKNRTFVFLNQWVCELGKIA